MAERFISTSRFPQPPARKTAVLENLSGGLNLWELDHRMDAKESPEMKNLWWRDGLLSCRDGQEYVSDLVPGKGICCFEGLFYGYMVAHISDCLYGAIPGSSMTLTKLCDGLPEERGTFVRYHDALLYKTKGAYKKITFREDTLKAEEVEAYVPVTVINCTPGGSGDLYQPENRLSPKKTVWFTAARATYGVTFSVERMADDFVYETADGEAVASVEQVYVGSTLQDPSAYTLSEDLKKVSLKKYVEAGETVTVVYTVGIRE